MCKMRVFPLARRSGATRIPVHNRRSGQWTGGRDDGGDLRPTENISPSRCSTVQTNIRCGHIDNIPINTNHPISISRRACHRTVVYTTMHWLFSASAHLSRIEPVRLKFVRTLTLTQPTSAPKPIFIKVDERAIRETRQHTCEVLRDAVHTLALRNLSERLVGMDLTLAIVRHRLFERILTGVHVTYPSRRPHGTYVIQRGPGFRKSDNRGFLNARALTEKGGSRNIKHRYQSYSRVERREIGCTATRNEHESCCKLIGGRI